MSANDKSSTTIEQLCGCKGIRFCARCVESKRVQSWSLDSRVEPFRHYQKYVYSSRHKKGVSVATLGTRTNFDDIRALSVKFNDMAVLCEEDCIELEGLIYVNDFLTFEEEQSLVEAIDRNEWSVSQSGRRKQDYGPQVNFKGKKVKMARFVGMPNYVDLILNRMERLSAETLGCYHPFELCNLEYVDERLSTIEMHFDDCWIWGNRLISLNLLNPCVLTYANDATQKLVYVYLPRRTLICMRNIVRYNWRHAVLPEHICGRRIALTMREPSKRFQEGGELYEKFGRELIRIGNIRIKS